MAKNSLNAVEDNVTCETINSTHLVSKRISISMHFSLMGEVRDMVTKETLAHITDEKTSG